MIRIEDLYKIFGPQPAQAVDLLRQGETKAAILARTGHVVAVAGVSLAVSPRTIFAIMGLSGSGKSTLLRCVNRLVEPTAGRVARAPDPAADRDHHLRPDGAAARAHGADAPPLYVDAEDLGVRGDGEGAAGLGVLAHERAGAQGLDHPDPGAKEAAQDDLLVDDRDALLDLAGRQELGGLPPRPGRGQPALELLHALRGPRELDTAALG